MTAFTIRSYDHDGLLLNLYGSRDEDGCEVEIVTAADSAIDLTMLFGRATLLSMGEIADARLAREAKQQRTEAAADAYQWERNERAGVLRVLSY